MLIEIDSGTYDLSKVESIHMSIEEARLTLGSGNIIRIRISGRTYGYSVVCPSNMFKFIKHLCNRENQKPITHDEFISQFLEWAA